MSEFECSNGHLPTPSTIKRNRCPCGAPIIRMDGKTARQLAYEDKMWEARCQKEEIEKERRKDEEGGEEE